jgi:alpha-1,3-glucan synthase
MKAGPLGLLAVLLAATSTALKYESAYLDYNLNQNETAVHPLDYSGEWEGHTFTPSPEDWRFPFYTLFLDKFVNGDPTNDNINGTVFEHDLSSNQMRHGGDVSGLVDTLDYLQGMGIKVIGIFPIDSTIQWLTCVGTLSSWLNLHESTLGCGWLFST